MPPTLQTIKSCCGSSAVIVNAVKPIKKEHVDLFKSSGFKVNDIYAANGLFFAKKGDLSISCTFGLTKINLKCSSECSTIINELIQILTHIENMN